MSYIFWNTFIDDWKKNPSNTLMAHGGWTNPIGLLNSNNPADNTVFYLPEPWWGNSGTAPLHSVVINYNPFTGGGLQHHIHCAPGLFGNPDYSSFVDGEISGRTSILHGTNCWHNTKRAQPVFNALIASGIALTFPRIENHLSIELIPWHTPTPNDTNFAHYVSNNLNQIFNYSILFAANESRRVANPKLKNKVILRMNKTSTENLLKQFRTYGIISGYLKINEGTVPSPIFAVGSGSFYKFQILQNGLDDIEFICIWKPKGGWTRNDFPKSPQMQYIFNMI